MNLPSGEAPHRWRTLFAVAITCAVASACGGGGEGGSGQQGRRYQDQIYSDADVVLHADIPYSSRPNENHSQFTDDATKAQELASDTLVLRLDVHVPPGASVTDRRPLLLWVHGGGLVEGSKSVLAPYARTYARAGYVVAALNYRLTPRLAGDERLRGHVIGQTAEDTMNAVRWLKLHADAYGIDASRIALMAYSSGGVVAMVEGIGADELTDAVNDYPGTSAHVDGVVSTGATLVGSTWDSDAMLHYDATDAPVLLMHADPRDPVTGATWTGSVLPTCARITDAGNECTPVHQPTTDHMGDLSEGGAYSRTDIDPFLHRVLRLP